MRRSARVQERAERAGDEVQYEELEVPQWTEDEYNTTAAGLLALCNEAVISYGNPANRQQIEQEKDAAGQLNRRTMNFHYVSYYKIAAAKVRGLQNKYGQTVTYNGCEVQAEGALFELMLECNWRDRAKHAEVELRNSDGPAWKRRNGGIGLR